MPDFAINLITFVVGSCVTLAVVYLQSVRNRAEESARVRREKLEELYMLIVKQRSLIDKGRLHPFSTAVSQRLADVLESSFVDSIESSLSDLTFTNSLDESLTYDPWGDGVEFHPVDSDDLLRMGMIVNLYFPKLEEPLNKAIATFRNALAKFKQLHDEDERMQNDESFMGQFKSEDEYIRNHLEGRLKAVKEIIEPARTASNSLMKCIEKEARRLN